MFYSTHLTLTMACPRHGIGDAPNRRKRAFVKRYVYVGFPLFG